MKSSTRDKYKKTLTFLYEQLPMFQRVGKQAFKKDLSNSIAFGKYLDQPHEKFPSIHIAGTNGKGSTTHLIGAMLQGNGYKVGYYTSPHYRDFRERIKINGQFISKKYVTNFIDHHLAFIRDIKPSFFEITVAMAFDYFARKKVDIAIVETGLGGRLDSTNILNPILSVITNISYDHQEFLGDTLGLITKEKAGIIKEKVPVIIGETQEEIAGLFEEIAKRKNAPIIFADKWADISKTIAQPGHTVHDVRFNLPFLKTPANPLRAHPELQDLIVDLTGEYQKKNLVTALMTIHQLSRIKLFSNISEAGIRTGLKDLKALSYFIGRWQWLSHNPRIVCDSAHNEAGIQQVIHQLKQLTYDRLHFVLGMVKDKETEKVLRLLPVTARYYFVKANIPRGLAADRLKEKAEAYGLNGRAYSSVKNGLLAAKRNAEANDLIFVGGSIFVVGEVV